MQRKHVITLMLLLVALAGLASCHHNIHPGAISTVDSNAYDSLLVAQAALDEGRKIIAEKPEQSYKDAFNKAVAVYNQAEADWQLYHSTKDPALATKLSGEVTDVIKTVADMRTAFGKKVGQ